MILLAVVGVLLVIAIGAQLWYWYNAASLGVPLPRTLKVIMGMNIAVLVTALFGVAWFGLTACGSGGM